ncbi:MAG: hypothetical protein K8F25_14940 [Fimbriimonadaceae bacterium]|nr:hypothetical protein [Alphaproteobacteria bacterium]
MRCVILLLCFVVTATTAHSKDVWAKLFWNGAPELVLSTGEKHTVFTEAAGANLAECPEGAYWLSIKNTLVRCLDGAVYSIEPAPGEDLNNPTVYSVFGDPDEKTDEPGPMLKQMGED